MKPETLTAAATLFAPANVTRWQFAPGSFPYSRDVRKFYGTNPPPGGSIEYLLTKPAKEVSLKVVDVNGKAVREFRSPATAVGFHRVQWSPPKAGGYRVVLTVDGKEFAQMAVAEKRPERGPEGGHLRRPAPRPRRRRRRGRGRRRHAVHPESGGLRANRFLVGWALPTSSRSASASSSAWWAVPTLQELTPRPFLRSARRRCRRSARRRGRRAFP